MNDPGGGSRLTVTDDLAEHRYEARVRGRLAGFLVYAASRHRIELIHTEVLPSFRGQGVGEGLVRFALDDAHQRGRRVIPTCPYVRAFLERHPGLADGIQTSGSPPAR